MSGLLGLDGEAVRLLAAQDGELAIVARGWTATLRLVIGDRRLDVRMVDGRMVSFGPASEDPAEVIVSGPVPGWEGVLAAMPAPGYVGLEAAAFAGITIEGDRVASVEPYRAAIRRIIQLVGDAWRGRRAHEPGTGLPRGSDVAVGRYVHISVDDVEYRVFYEEAGSGIPLLLQHTAGADARQWRHLLADPVLQRSFRMIAYDLPYHGRSLPPDSVAWWTQEYAPTRSTLHGWIRAIAKGVGAERPIFMGTSLGGQLAPELLAHHPDDFSAAVAINGWYHMARFEHFDNARFRHPRIASEAFADLMYQATSPLAPEALRREVAWVYATGGPGVYKGDNEYFMRGHDLRADAHLIDTARTPLYVVACEYDRSTLDHESGAAAIVANVPGAQLRPLAGMSHFAMADDPARFNAAIRPILEEITRDAG